MPSIDGKLPNKYPLKSQFIVTKYFINPTLYCITNAFIMLGDMNPNSEIVIARALFVNIVLSANASVASNIIIGNCVNISIPTYVNIFNISNWLVLKLYSNTGTDRLSNPNTTPPTINSINRIIAIANTVIINIVIYFDNRIFVLLYGLINNNLTVPLLNSSLTIVPAIITIVLNSSYLAMDRINKIEKI